jgi:hypothetical protein
MKSVHSLLLPLLVLSLSCRHSQPVAPIQPPTVSLIRSPKCNLPSLPPDVHPTVGFPTPETVMVSKTDYAEMLAFATAAGDWIRAANACLLAGQQ